MTSQQKNILIFLAIADLIFVCCLLPAVAFVATQPADADPVQMAMDTAKGFLPATLTPRATSTRTATPGPTQTIAPGWKLYSVPKDGYAMALPNSWVYQELDAATIDQMVATLKKQNSPLTQVLETQGKQLIASGIRFYAIDGAAGSTMGGIATNCNIIRHTETQVYSLDYAVTSSINALEGQSMVVKPITHRRVQLPVGEAEQLRYALNLTLANNQTIKTPITQYLVMRGKDSYIITFTTHSSLDAKYLPTFESIIKTFRFVP
jgi:hypothetical protein